jgi:hypothetical protein
MAKFIEVKAWVIVDGDENHVVGESQEAVTEKYGDEVGDDHSTPRRTICVTLTVPVPEVVRLAGEVAADPEPGELKAV